MDFIERSSPLNARPHLSPDWSGAMEVALVVVLCLHRLPEFARRSLGGHTANLGCPS